MCSVDSCTNLKLEKKLNLTGANCRKCEDKKAQVVLQGKFPYCRECFLIYFQHKYSGGIGKAKVLKPGDNVLVAFSGSFSSICLLRLIHLSLIEDRKKKTKFNVTVIFIDERNRRTEDERNHVFKCINDLVSGYGYKVIFTYLTPLGENVHLSEDPHNLPNANDDKLTLILSQATKTNREDITERLRLNILYKAARQLKCNKIFTAETSDHIATKLIGNIAIGRGGQLSEDTGFISTANENIILIRPLRECSKKEVTFFNVFHNLHLLEYPSTLEEDKFSSIQKLSETFITELQQSFPSTVATVVSTGSKLTITEKKGKTCLICQHTLDKENKDLTAEEAMRISQDVSNNGPEGFNCHDFVPFSNTEGTSLNFTEGLPICYACHIIIKECKMTEDALKTLVHNGHIKIQHHEMQEKIKDFLL